MRPSSERWPRAGAVARATPGSVSLELERWRGRHPPDRGLGEGQTDAWKPATSWLARPGMSGPHALGLQTIARRVARLPVDEAMSGVQFLYRLPSSLQCR